MKKNLVILFVFIFSAFLGYSQENKKSDLEKDNIKGKVKYIEESTYFPKGLFCNGKEMDIHREYKITKFNRDGNIEHEIIRGYHDYNRRITPLKTIIYKYNSRGQKQECFELKDSIVINDKYIYDSIGNLIEKASYDRLQELILRIIYRYDSKNNLVEIYRYWNKSDSLTRRYVFKYNDSIAEKIHYVFNDKGQVIMESYNYFFTEGDCDHYKYDSKGNQISLISYSNNKIYYRSERKYDDNNNLIEKRSYDSKDSLSLKHTMEYKYDKRSNWIWQKFLAGDKNNEDRIIERRIVYYGDKDENNYPLWDNPNYKAEEIETENMKVKF